MHAFIDALSAESLQPTDLGFEVVHCGVDLHALNPPHRSPGYSPGPV
jgi:hypothetical protein